MGARSLFFVLTGGVGDFPHRSAWYEWWIFEFGFNPNCDEKQASMGKKNLHILTFKPQLSESGRVACCSCSCRGPIGLLVLKACLLFPVCPGTILCKNNYARRHLNPEKDDTSLHISLEWVVFLLILIICPLAPAEVISSSIKHLHHPTIDQ